MGKVKEECLNCRNYAKGICKGIKNGQCSIEDPIHKIREKDWWLK